MSSGTKQLLIKSLGFRVVAIVFTSFFTSIETSLVLNLGLFLLYYLYDLIWMKYLK